MAIAICAHCGQIHEKVAGDRGFSVLRRLDEISVCCPKPFFKWKDE